MMPMNLSSSSSSSLPTPTSAARRQRLVFFMHYSSSVLLQLLVIIVISSHHSSLCDAGWIDPDTPAKAMTVKPLKVQQAPPPKPAASSSSAHDKKKKTTAKDDDDTADDDDSTTTTSNANHGTTAARNRNPPTYSPTTDTPSTDPSSVPSSSPSIIISSTTSSNNDPNGRRIYSLVFSDEFNTPHRSFTDGSDPRWTALDKNDYTNDAQHYYSSSNAYTDTNGHLIIKSEAQDTTIVGFNDVQFKKEQVTKHFTSAMLQSWNKFCFTGGIIEAEMALPGKHNVGGLWPAFWLLGNLARHTYVGSAEHVWPWSSSVCTDKSRTAQLVSACDRVQHYGLHTGFGRGAPEIDIFEVQAGNVQANTGAFLRMPVGQPFLSSSYQVAPGRLPRPGEGWYPAPGLWYDHLTWGVNATLNIAFYGTYNHFLDATDPASQDYWSDAISFNRQLDSSHFGQFHKYRVEWELPDPNGNVENNYTAPTYGYIRWFLDDQFILEVDGLGLHTSGTGGEISSEPMYMLLNTAISSQWGFPKQCPANCPCKKYNCNGGFQETCGFSEGFCAMIQTEPVEYKINWVRVYQDKNDPKQKVGCSTKERPTRKFIEAHEKKYKQEGDVHPLLDIQNGGGTCSPTVSTDEVLPESCGGVSRGVCLSKSKPHTCQCLANWTGPHCLNPTGYDDIIWDPPETWSDLGFSGPSFRGGMGIIIVVLSMMGILFVAPVVLKKRRRKMEGYKRVKSARREVAPEYEQRVVA